MPPAGEDEASDDGLDRVANPGPGDGSPDGDDPLDVSGTIGPDADTGTDGGTIRWLLKGDDTTATFIREFVGSALVVVLIGMVLFAVSGVWPPMVAVKSGSMEPHMERGDLVFVMEETRFPPEASVQGTGIATYRTATATGYRRFGGYGDVIIYRKNGNPRSTPIIHRARFWVSGGENWYDRANESFVDGEDCDAIDNCPAPHAGFITKGDANDHYDQVSGISGPVKPEWIKGTGEFRIPWLGHIRLELSELTVGGPRLSAVSGATASSLVGASPMTGVSSAGG